MNRWALLFSPPEGCLEVGWTCGVICTARDCCWDLVGQDAQGPRHRYILSNEECTVGGWGRGGKFFR